MCCGALDTAKAGGALPGDCSPHGPHAAAFDAERLGNLATGHRGETPCPQLLSPCTPSTESSVLGFTECPRKSMYRLSSSSASAARTLACGCLSLCVNVSACLQAHLHVYLSVCSKAVALVHLLCASWSWSLNGVGVCSQTPRLPARDGKGV